MYFNFKSLHKFYAHFKDEKTCYEFLAEQRWDGKPVCPHCGSEKVTKGPTRSRKPELKDVPAYRCGNRKCDKHFTVKVGSIFEASKITLQTWFAAIYLITAHKKGISSLQLSRDLGVTQKTAWFLLHRVREMLKETEPEMLTGTIEVDETYVGGKSKNWHAKKRKAMAEAGTGYVHKTPVVGLLQRNGKVVAFKIQKADGPTLKPIVNERLAKGATLMTDGFGAYTGLSSNFNHVVINHAQGVYGIGEFNTNSIEGFWGLFKRGIFGIYHNVSPKHLDRYCVEFAYRYNTRKTANDVRFNEVFDKINTRLKYRELTKKEEVC